MAGHDPPVLVSAVGERGFPPSRARTVMVAWVAEEAQVAIIGMDEPLIPGCETKEEAECEAGVCRIIATAAKTPEEHEMARELLWKAARYDELAKTLPSDGSEDEL